MATLGEIAKSHGFNSVSEYVDAIDKLCEIAKKNSFNVGDKIKLNPNYKSTHFGYEKMLPFNTEFTIIEKSYFTLDSYSVKIDGYDIWFQAQVFELAK